MASLLEQPGATRLCLAELLARLAVRIGDELPGLVAGRGQDLVPLALALLAEPLDVALALLDVLLALAHFVLGALKLCCRGALRVALEHVGELGGLADEVERIHANCVAGRVDLCGATGGLQDPELRLQLDGVATEGVERLANTGFLVAALDDDEIVDARQ